MKSRFDVAVEQVLSEIQWGKLGGDILSGAAKLGLKTAGAIGSTALGAGPSSGWSAGQKAVDTANSLKQYGGGNPPEKQPTPGQASAPSTTSQQSQEQSATPQGRPLKSIAPKMTDQRIETLLRQSGLQPGDVQALKGQIGAMVRSVKGNVTDQQLAGIVGAVLASK